MDSLALGWYQKYLFMRSLYASKDTCGDISLIYHLSLVTRNSLFYKFSCVYVFIGFNAWRITLLHGCKDTTLIV